MMMSWITALPLILLASTICHCSQMLTYQPSQTTASIPQPKRWSETSAIKIYVIEASIIIASVGAILTPNVSAWDICIELCLWSCVHLTFSIWLWHHPVEIIMQSPAPIYNVKWKHEGAVGNPIHSVDKTVGAGPVISSVTVAPQTMAAAERIKGRCLWL